VAGLTKFIEPNYAAKELCNWAEEKFNIEVDPEEFIIDAQRGLLKPRDEIVDLLSDRAKKSYRRREIEYPIDHTLATVFGEGATSTENTYGIEYLRNWTRAKYGVELSSDEITGKPMAQLRDKLLAIQEKAISDANVDGETDKLLEGNPSIDEIRNRWGRRFGIAIDPRLIDPAFAGSTKGKRADTDAPIVDQRTLVRHQVRGVFRYELTQLEQYVLISIFDQSWKDHLYAMDMLKGGIGLQSFAEKDPRIAYKREGFRYFREMMMAIRDKVTGMIFRVYVGGKEKQKPQGNYNATSESGPSDDQNYDIANNTRETATMIGQNPDGTAEQQPAVAAPVATATITREVAKLGRNDTCPQGSGQKYKRCCGKFREDGVCDGSGKSVAG
jgi:preprotein translocase subunit SecA